MLLRAIIIDDEETGVETLKLLIEKHVPDLKLVGEATRASKALELIESYKPEVVFLDISMPEMNGFDLLEKLTWRSFNLVFITAYQEYGLRALKQDAVDYLLKPVDYRELLDTVARIRRQITEQQQSQTRFEYTFLNNVSQYYTSKLSINSKKGVEYVDSTEILYFESKSNYTLVCMKEGEPILTPKTLRDFEAQLCSTHNFMRVHHSFIINLHKVQRFLKEEDCIVMNNQKKIPVSKSRKISFMQWLAV